MPASHIRDLNRNGGRGLNTDPLIHRARYEHVRSVRTPDGSGWINHHNGYTESLDYPSDRWFRVFYDVPVDEVIMVYDHDTGDEDPAVSWNPNKRWSRE